MDKAIQEAAMKLFREEAFTLSKDGSDVTLSCDNGDEANTLFDWLCDITGEEDESP
jgi:hypothetical protein